MLGKEEKAKQVESGVAGGGCSTNWGCQNRPHGRGDMEAKTCRGEPLGI